MAEIDGKKQSGRLTWALILLLLAVLIFVLWRQSFFSGISTVPQAPHGAAQGPDSRASTGRAARSPAQAQDMVDVDPNSPAPSASSSWYVTVAFRGVVRNERNRQPVEGASVRIYAYASPPAAIDKTTAAGGTFEVVAPPAYRYGVRVEAEGYRLYQDDSFVITRPYYNLDILLSPVLSLRGRVVDDLNAGIADAQVQMRRVDDAAVITSVSDAQGVFVFPEVPRQGRYFVEAYHSGYDSQGLATISLPLDGDLVMRMSPSRSIGSLAGTVTDKGGKTLPGARVSLYEPGDGRLVSTTTSGRNGSFKFAKMRDGFYVVRCAADGFAETEANQGAVRIYADRETRIDFSLDPGLQIRGIVLNNREEPVVQAQVTYNTEDASETRVPAAEDQNAWAGRRGSRGGAQRARNLSIATTDAEGRFQILGLPNTPAQYQVSVSHRDYQTLVAGLRPSDETQKLVMDPGLILRGSVSDNQGAAVERFMITFQSKSGRIEKTYSFTTSDGHFEIRGLARDNYQVSLQSQGRGRFSGSLDLQASAEIVVMLEGGRGRGQSSLELIKTK